MQRSEPASPIAGSFRMFQVAGISVYLHWSWLLVAYLEVQFRQSAYTSQIWNVAEYLMLFAIVLLHEFGHALACRQVGGRADQIILWPLGGIAYVQPPPRPGPWLWSIAAGPLVNAVLVPVTIGIWAIANAYGLQSINTDAAHFVDMVLFINLGLLIFNMLPIYPLDGGQILQSLLWFFIGRSTSLKVVSVIGLVVAAIVVVLAVIARELWFGIMAIFVGMRCYAGFRQAQMLARLAALPRHQEAACPWCRAHPLIGDFWKCNQCHARFDTFETLAACPNCGQRFPETTCLDCGEAHPIAEWFPRAEHDPIPHRID